MNTNTARGYAAVIALLLLLPISANAKDMSMYGGFGFGYSILELDAPSDDRASTAGKLYLGARIVGPVGIEAAYINLGKYSGGDDKISATTVTVVGHLDTKGAMLFAKAGVVNWKVEDVPGATEITGNDTTYGIGVDIPIESNVVFRTELEHFTKIGKDQATANPGNNMKLISFGVNFMF